VRIPGKGWLVLVMLLAWMPAQATAQDRKTAEAEIRTILETFANAVKQRDRETFLGLFVDRDVSWIGVMSEAEYARQRGKPGVPGKLLHSNPSEFMDLVAQFYHTPTEKFSNVVIHTDGEVASVYFDYKFFHGPDLHNWGAESWMLVRGEAGWKIHAANFSYNTP
jgi:ketosteroid isomerase-like protein